MGPADRHHGDRLKARLELMLGREDARVVRALALDIIQFIHQEFRVRRRIGFRFRVLALVLAAVCYLEMAIWAERRGDIHDPDSVDI